MFSAAPDDIVANDSTAADLVEDAGTRMVLDAIPLDERPNVVTVVPDAVPAVVVNEVVAERDVGRQGNLLLRAIAAVG